MPKIPTAKVATRVARRETTSLGLVGAESDSCNSDESNDMPLVPSGTSLGDFDEWTVSLDRICKHNSYRRFYYDLFQRCGMQESSNCKSDRFNTC